MNSGSCLSFMHLDGGVVKTPVAKPETKTSWVKTITESSLNWDQKPSDPFFFFEDVFLKKELLLGKLFVCKNKSQHEHYFYKLSDETDTIFSKTNFQDKSKYECEYVHARQMHVIAENILRPDSSPTVPTLLVKTPLSLKPWICRKKQQLNHTFPLSQGKKS